MTTPAHATAPAVKPLIKRPSGAKYRTILSLDGGGVRGLISCVILEHLETKIKSHIIAERTDLIPKNLRSSVTGVDDFDVDLTDYFDLVAGTSIGSWLAMYIASRGKGTTAVFNDKSIPQNDRDRMRVGSMEAFRYVFHHYARRIFPRRNIFTRIARLYRPLFPPDGIESVLKTVFGESTLKNDVETGLLVSTFDLGRNVACSFLRGSVNNAQTYTVRTAVRRFPRRSAQDGASTQDERAVPREPWIPDLDIIEGTDFKLGDLALASSAAPTYFRPARVKEIGKDETLTLIDGGVVANNPTLQALTYAPTCFSGPESLADIRNVAVFSLGTGTTDPRVSTNADPGIGWWIGSGYLMDIFREGAGEYIQAVVDYWFYRNIGPGNGSPAIGSGTTKYGQYVRIQKSAPRESELGEIFADLAGVDNLPRIEEIGRELAQENNEAIEKFVKEFIFAV